MIGIDDIILTIAPEACKGIAKSIPNAIDKVKFKNFFGIQALEGKNIHIVLDPYEHPVSRSQLRSGQARFVKRFHGLKNDSPIIGEDKLLGVCSIRITKYASETFSKFRSKNNSVPINLDEQVINAWDATFLCFGSSDTNAKTFEIEKLQANNLYSFGIDKNGQRCYTVNGEQFAFANKKDRAILARFVNPYHQEHFLFICGGLGEWGTSGATYFLFDNWKLLNKRFARRKNFCLIIEVDMYSDESAREIYSYSV